ncbi:DUF4202 domain-containing protein [Shimia sp. FJ5]|uniref:DUF4202 domain-containing protein n=1 Tax=Shimia sp. FJ5 TaxID=3079054 RepID=UPI00260A441A|nr:DUF4202 domain-containing protein [Shimia sp. FJ5]MDV4146117.1 DUF4202 domain-containing protein [Shimia sp. FJ5]
MAHSMSARLETALRLIDAANSQDPKRENGEPAERLYGHRMSAEAKRLFPEASEHLQIAARGQHVERWLLPRSDYPLGRIGYLEWRKEQGRRHGERIAGIMREAGYSEDDAARVAAMLRKERLKRDPEVQALEDIACFVFLTWYFAPFADRQSAEALDKIVMRTARKMSAEARARVLREFDLPEQFAKAFRDQGPG